MTSNNYDTNFRIAAVTESSTNALGCHKFWDVDLGNLSGIVLVYLYLYWVLISTQVLEFPEYLYLLAYYKYILNKVLITYT